MKKTPILSLAAVCLLAQCNQAPQQVAAVAKEPAGPSVPVISTDASPHFMKVVSHLEVGGASFNYADQDGLFEKLASIGDEIVKGLPEKDRKDLPKDFSFTKVLGYLGLGGVKAAGGSSRHTASGIFHSRSFASIPEGRKGLMTLSGGPAEPFLTHQTAPKGTDLALEFPLHLKTFTRDSLPSLLALLKEEERAEVEAKLSQPLPPLGLTVREIGEKLDARLALFIKANPDQKLPIPGSEIPLPGVDVILVADRIGWLLEPVKKQFLPMLNNPEAPFALEEKDGILTLGFKEPMGPAPMDFQPVLRFDSKADRLYIATRPAYLKQAIEGADKLANEDNFKKAWTGLPAEGNAAFFLSARMLTLMSSTLRESVGTSAEPQEVKENIGKVLDYLAPYINKDQAFSMSNLPDGTLGAGNLVIPLSDTSTLSTLTTISIMSSLAVPTFSKINNQAAEMKVASEGRQIGSALQLYATDNNGQYPASLELLGDYLGEGDDNLLKKSTTTWLYNSKLTADAPEDAILLATAEPTYVGRPKRCVVRKSGIVEHIFEEQFEIEKDDNLQ